MPNPVAIHPYLTASNKDISQARLEMACSEFESIFLTYMLKSMRETLAEGGLFGNSNESKIMKSMFDESLARGIAKGGGIGLGKMIFERMKSWFADIFN